MLTSYSWPGIEIVALVALLGACIGSFLNVVVWRLPREESLLRPPSHCTRCGSTLAWWDNLPVFSWAWLRGRCRSCLAPIHVRYPATEILCAGLWLLALLARPDAMGPGAARPLVVIAGWLLASLLLLLALIDIDQLWIPEPICRWGVVAGWLMTALLGWQQSPAIGRQLLLTHGLAAALGLLGFECLSALGARWLGKPAMGSGDAKVGAMLGAWLGLAGLALACMLAVMLAALLGSLALLTRLLKRHQPIPFVPFMAVGAAMIWFTGTAPWLRLLLGRG